MSLFTNPKAALAFAAVTLVGAVAIVGTSEEDGVLPTVVERLNASQREDGAAPAAAAAPPPTVFGDYAPEVPASTDPAAPGAPPIDPSAPPGSYTEVIMSPTGEAIPIMRDDPAYAPQ